MIDGEKKNLLFFKKINHKQIITKKYIFCIIYL